MEITDNAMDITTKFNEFDVVYMADVNKGEVLKMRVRQIHIAVWSSSIRETYSLEGGCYKENIAARFLFATPEEADKFLREYENQR